MPKEKRTLTALLDYSDAYASASKKYITLLGNDDYNLIVTNPGPNSANMTKQERLASIPKLIRQIYSREYTTVPSCELNVNVGEDKDLRISIADIYDPMVLTYGERTGACLRLGGLYDKLFKYCLGDENGFHIKFSDPETGNFVSRVTGIRNGNTVFLNQLRLSVDDKYSKEDLIKATRAVAEFIVEYTRDDTYPIDNVIISNYYAMNGQPSIQLHLPNFLEPFRSLPFDIVLDGVVLYSSSIDDHNELVPYEFSDDDVTRYKPLNRKVQGASKQMARQMINRVHMINEIMNGKSIDEINMLDLGYIDKCIYGNGWVVYTDGSDNMHEIIIDKFKDDKDLLKFIEENKKKYLGGKTYETNR